PAASSSWPRRRATTASSSRRPSPAGSTSCSARRPPASCGTPAARCTWSGRPRRRPSKADDPAYHRRVSTATAAASPQGARRHTLSAAERRSMVLASLAVLALHVLGWGSLFLLVGPAQLELGGAQGQVFGVAVGITAFTL